jgi:ubiquinone/menaquinone biosynthesis C-methylase UbiE
LSEARGGGVSAEAVTQANIEYHDALAARYDERAELFHPRIQAVYRRIFEEKVFARLGGGTLRALDVGCGTGFLEHFLVGRCRVVAYDVSEGMLARARAQFPEVEFRVGDAYALAPPDGPFDVVCENALLHHLKDWERALERLCAQVRPGGALFLGYEPNALAFRVLKPVRAVYRRVAPEHRVQHVAEEHSAELERLAEYHQFFSDGLDPREVRRRLEAMGFEVEVLYRAEHFLGQLRDRLGWRLVDWVPFAPLRLVGPLALNFHVVAWRRP